jgi:hypothetical protein
MAGIMRHTIDAASIIPAQKPRKISFSLWEIFLISSPIAEPSSEAMPSPAALIRT